MGSHILRVELGDERTVAHPEIHLASALRDPYLRDGDRL